MPIPCVGAALLWHFTVLGEAASQVPAETRQAHPVVAWKGATRMRNRIVHDYMNIDMAQVRAWVLADKDRFVSNFLLQAWPSTWTDET